MKQKKLLVLGGNIIQAEAIIKAKELGYYVISADLFEDNPGHKYADEYHKLDISDKEAVLNESRRFGIDGIIPYSSDALSLISAYVAEEMGLPGNPYESVKILTRKDLLCDFLRTNGFAAPWSKSFSNLSDAVSYYLNKTSGSIPAIMKPVDSSGSRGVFKIREASDISENWNVSMNFSVCKRIIIEQFIEKCSPQLDVEVFVSEGRIIFAGFLDQHDADGCYEFVPVTLSYPSTHTDELKKRILAELQRLFSLLNVTTGPGIVECVLGKDGKIYFFDIGLRNGGPGLPYLQRMATGFDEDSYTVKAAAGDKLPGRKDPFMALGNRFVMYYRPSPGCNGIYRGLWISEKLRSKVKRIIPLMDVGKSIVLQHNGNDSVAVVYSCFENSGEMNEMIENIGNHLKVLVD